MEGQGEGESPQERQKGTVKWFNATKGFGFITPADGGEDLFVHQSSVQAEGFRSLREGEEVEYDVDESPDGRTKAVKVTGPDGAAPQGAPRRSSYRSTGAAPPAYRGGGGGGRGGPPGGRGPPPAYYDYSGGYDYYGGYYPGYYPPRGGYRGRGPPGGGHYPPVRGRGRAPYAPGVPPGAAAEPSGLQVVVHNLPWSCTWQQLKDSFKEFRVERADIVYDGWGKSRGFGTVRFGTKEDAEAACTKLNNTDMEGRTITVRLDRYA